MKEKVYIRYIGKEEDDSVIPFAELGESLIGFDETIRRLSKVMRIDCEVELKAKASQDGSFIVDAIVQFGSSFAEAFTNIQSFLEFAQLCGKEVYNDAVTYFNEFENAKKTLNEYFKERPIDLAIVVGCIAYLLNKVGEIGKAKKLLSEDVIIQNLRDELSERVTKDLLSILKRKSLLKAIRPLVEDVAESIEVSPDREFKRSAIIDQGNFQDYLSDADQILPGYDNEMTYPFDGKITSIKSTRGDSMTFHTLIDGLVYNLDLYPEEGYTTKAYLNFYQEHVHILATVLRKSLYKKPKLKLYSIELNQKRLDFRDETESE